MEMTWDGGRTPQDRLSEAGGKRSTHVRGVTWRTRGGPRGRQQPT